MKATCSTNWLRRRSSELVQSVWNAPWGLSSPRRIQATTSLFAISRSGRPAARSHRSEYSQSYIKIASHHDPDLVWILPLHMGQMHLIASLASLLDCQIRRMPDDELTGGKHECITGAPPSTPPDPCRFFMPWNIYALYERQLAAWWESHGHLLH